MGPEGLIPTRRKVGQPQARQVARGIVDKLMAGWGLANAGKIVREEVRLVKEERKKRKMDIDGNEEGGL